MTFPTTGVLDSFTRANENPLAGNWVAFGTSFYGAGNVLKLLSNAVTAATALGGASAYNTSFGPDCEAYVTLATLPADGDYTLLWLRAANNANPNGYRVAYVFSAGGTDTVAIQRMDAGSITALASFGQDFSAGDKFGASIVGTVITAYRYTAGAWASVGTYDTAGDGTKYSGAGLLALNARDQTQSLDDFGGGTVVVVPANTVAPLISGSAAVGELLSCDTGTWTGSPTSYAYQWNRAGTPVGGATTSTYTSVNADIGNVMTCTVTASNTAGSASAVSSNSITVVSGGGGGGGGSTGWGGGFQSGFTG